MQKLTVVLLFCVAALSFVSADDAKLESLVSAEGASFKSLTPFNAEPYCPDVGFAWCGEKIYGTNNQDLQ
jgi:hypothetical protein